MMSSRSGDFQQELIQCQEIINERLCGYFTEDTGYSTLLESMRYSLLDGGKRIRAVICLKFCEAVGGEAESALEAACALEMLHAYSLIHDDLPCMDDDDMRRGKPSNHIKYGEFTAMLAGDALQASAFGTLIDSGLPPADVLAMVRIMAEAAGPHGICGGQYLDLSGEGRRLDIFELLEIHSKKTAALLSAAARIGVIAGGGTPAQIEAADEYAYAVGLAFQLRDDVLDRSATAEELGKPVGSDIENNKTTVADLLRPDDCEAMIHDMTAKAIAALDGDFGETGFLIWLAGMLAIRKK